VASGECAVALTNSYYLARLMRSQAPADREAIEKIGVVFPNQADHGTHVNVAGGAVAHYAKHKAAAVQFLEYLSGAEAQGYFANGNNEWPAVVGTQLANPALETLGKFKAESLPTSVIGNAQTSTAMAAPPASSRIKAGRGGMEPIAGMAYIR
jgi:iron(III) transport system substrate-binding protein